MPRRYLRLRAAGLAATLLAVTPAHAAAFKLVTGDGLPPLTGQNLRGGGLATELVRTALERAGHSVAIRFVPWRRAAGLVRAGRADAAFPYVTGVQRRQRYAFSRPILSLPLVPVVDRGDAGTIASAQDLKNKSVCRVMGFHIPEAVQARIESGKLDTIPKVPRLRRCLELVRAGHTDFLLAEKPVARHLAKRKLNAPSAFSLEDYVARRPGYRLMFHKKAETKRRQANDALAALQKTPAYRRIRNHHLD